MNIDVRTWNGKKMVYGPADDNISPSWVLTLCGAIGSEPLLYTGLKDKNDIKVYESDIVAVSDQSKNYQIQEVVFKDGMFCGYGDKKSCPYTSLDVLTRAYKIEVIGNKFENIDLTGVK